MFETAGGVKLALILCAVGLCSVLLVVWCGEVVERRQSKDKSNS